MNLRVNSRCTALSVSFLRWCVVCILLISTDATNAKQNTLQYVRMIQRIEYTSDSIMLD